MDSGHEQRARQSGKRKNSVVDGDPSSHLGFRRARRDRRHDDLPRGAVAHQDDAVILDRVFFGWHARNASPLSPRTPTTKVEKTMIRATTGEPLPTQIPIAFVDEDNLNNVPVAFIEAQPITLPAHIPWTREMYLREFRALTSKMLAITTKKNNDYGGANDPFKNFRTDRK